MAVPPIAGWFILGNPTKMGDGMGYPHFRKPQFVVHDVFGGFCGLWLCYCCNCHAIAMQLKWLKLTWNTEKSVHSTWPGCHRNVPTVCVSVLPDVFPKFIAIGKKNMVKHWMWGKSILINFQRTPQNSISHLAETSGKCLGSSESFSSFLFIFPFPKTAKTLRQTRTSPLKNPWCSIVL